MITQKGHGNYNGITCPNGPCAVLFGPCVEDSDCMYGNVCVNNANMCKNMVPCCRSVSGNNLRPTGGLDGSIGVEGSGNILSSTGGLEVSTGVVGISGNNLLSTGGLEGSIGVEENNQMKG